MWLSSLSIKRPYFAFMINLAIIIFGIIAYKKLPIANNPNVDLPYVWVGVTYPNASPVTEEELILKPLEDAVKGLSGVKSINGKAKEGRASLFIEFNLDVSGDRAYEDVRSAVSSIKFPDGADNPQVVKIQTDGEPIFEISVSAPDMSIEELSTIIKDNFQPRFQRVQGVSAVYLYGDRYPEIHIDLKENSLKSLNLSPLLVKSAVENHVFNANVGQFKDPQNTYPLTVYSIPNNLNSIAKIPLTLGKQHIIHLESVANIKDSVTEPASYSEYNGVSSLTIGVYKEAQGNIVKTAKEITAVIQSLNSEYKDKIALNVIHDDSTFIKNSVHGVQLDIVLGALFAVLTVFVFLHEWKNTLICMIAIPTSLIGALAVIHFLDFSLNFMTLFALTLCVGIVIDDAIVVVENIHRHRDLGKSPLQAAKDGTAEIGFAAIAVTLAIVSVFIPVAFMQGLIGRFFYEFGITVVAAVVISLFVAFTAVPMLSSRIKVTSSEHAVKPKIKFGIVFDKYFEKFQQLYLRVFHKTLKFKKTTLLCAFLVFVVSIGLLKFVPIVFNIESDQNLARISFDLKENTSLEVSQARGREIEAYIRTLPGVKDTLMRIGSGQEGSSNSIKFNVFLVDKNDRKFTDKEFLDHLANDLKQFIKSPQESVGFSHENYPVQISLLSQKSELLKDYGKQVADYMNTLPEVKGGTTSSEEPVIEYRVLPNETQSTLAHVNPTDLARTLQLLFDGVLVGKYDDNGKYLDIKMMLPRENRNSLSDLNSVFIPTQASSQVLLSSVAQVKKVTVEPKIEHLNGERVLTVKANYMGKDLSGVTNKIQKYVKKTIPVEISTQLSGQSSDMNEMFTTVGTAIFLAFIFVFMVLAVQFENIVAPISIILSIPFAFSGAFLALLITGTSLSLFSMIGLIMLMGIVTKNAILLIEFAQQRIKSGLEAEDALIESAQVRLRPIIMTTFTMIVGMLPMALSTSEGSEVSSNIAVTVIGGLISSTFLTLLIVPTVYLFIRKLMFLLKNHRVFSK